MRVPLVYHQRPLFGFDLGHNTAKMVQLHPINSKTTRVVGYGYAVFPADAVVEGIIVDPELIAKALRPLMKQMSFGKLTAGRVAASLPTSKIFTRQLDLPEMDATDLAQAVQFEAEQYIPVPLADLYIDYEASSTTDGKKRVLMVAAPRAVVDSYIKLFDLLGLEVTMVESSLSAVIRGITASQPLTEAVVIADFGAPSLDITVFDGSIQLSNTVKLGGDTLTQTLMDKLGLDEHHALEIKRKFGIAESGLQPKILDALGPHLTQVVAEIKRVARYYEERSPDKRKVSQVLITGGVAAMPGLIDYLSAQLGLKVQLANPWLGLDMRGIQGVTRAEAPIYATALGLARLEGQL